MLDIQTIGNIKRALAANELSQIEIAEKYGVCRRTIQKIAGGDVTLEGRPDRRPIRYQATEPDPGGSILERS